MSIRLSPRLRTIAELVPVGACVIDVGTDHAKLPVWLAQTGRARHIWASDVRTGPLTGAAALVAQTGTQSLVELRLTDGLRGFGPSDGDTVVIAGMGGETMTAIISEAPWVRENETLLILAPQSKPYVLRRWLTENGFSIGSEALTEDAGRIYPILTARGGTSRTYCEAELHAGRWEHISHAPLFGRYLDQLMSRAEASSPYDPEARALLQEYQKWKERLSSMPTVGAILELLNTKAPVGKKLDFDNVGLLVGRRERPVSKVLAALDITDEVIAEAIREGAELIMSHHPLFFELKAVADSSWPGERALTLAENRIAAICMHTNLDAARGGVNDALLRALGLGYVDELDPETEIGRVGELSDSVDLTSFLAQVKKALNGNGLRYHDAGRPVKRVAVCGGSGGSELALAHAAGCDTYVTADIKYDPFLEAKHLGINLIDADHFCTENVVIPVVKSWLEEAFPGLEVVISRAHGPTARFY